MGFKSWRCTKLNWVQPQATWLEFEVNLALWTGLKTSKTFQIKWFYVCSCHLPSTAPISDTTYTKKCVERQPFACITFPAYLHWICYPINWIYEGEKKILSGLWGAGREGKPLYWYKSAPNMKETGRDHCCEYWQLWDRLVLTCYFARGSPSLLFTPLLKLSYPTERTSVLRQQVPHQRCRTLILASGTSRIAIKIKRFCIGSRTSLWCVSQIQLFFWL